jgi:hypothetical protein
MHMVAACRFRAKEAWQEYEMFVARNLTRERPQPVWHFASEAYKVIPENVRGRRLRTANPLPIARDTHLWRNKYGTTFRTR